MSGCARGIDTLGIQWADAHDIPVKRFPANKDFELSSSLGGFARNGAMAAYADALILVWDGVSGEAPTCTSKPSFKQKPARFPSTS